MSDISNTLPRAFGNPAQKMTSSEIADLVESRHDKVKQSIDRLVERGVIVQPPLGDEPGTDAMGRPRVTKVYVFSGEQGKRDSIIVVAQLCPEFTARLVDRWAELEALIRQPVDPLVALNDPVLMRGFLLTYSEKIIALEQVNAELAPKAEALDLISAKEDSLTFRQSAKMLGVKQDTMTKWMHANGWIYRENGSWVAYRRHIMNGRLEFKEHTFTSQSTGMETRKQYCHLTHKGLAFLAEVFSEKKDAA